ncbi:MAG: bacterial Ig-like domain-containing protein, partial [Clostridia bacterium]|nr:bacterial Ig-like domain-containing protein [Clostridia bacterium]
GEKFNASGMIVYGVYPDGEKVEINVSDYTYTPQDTLADGDNTITVSYGELSATFTVRAGEGGVGNFDGSKYVSKKLYLITIIAVGGLLIACVIMAAAIIRGNRKTREYLRTIAGLRQGLDSQEQDSSLDTHSSDDDA